MFVLFAAYSYSSPYPAAPAAENLISKAKCQNTVCDAPVSEQPGNWKEKTGDLESGISSGMAVAAKISLLSNIIFHVRLCLLLAFCFSSRLFVILNHRPTLGATTEFAPCNFSNTNRFSQNEAGGRTTQKIQLPCAFSFSQSKKYMSPNSNMISISFSLATRPREKPSYTRHDVGFSFFKTRDFGSFLALRSGFKG